MANYIESRTSVPIDRVIIEDKSTTTYENLLFSKALGEKLVDNPKLLFVTNNYHVYCTSAYARKISTICKNKLYIVESVKYLHVRFFYGIKNLHVIIILDNLVEVAGT
jgi:membrane protein